MAWARRLASVLWPAAFVICLVWGGSGHAAEHGAEHRASIGGLFYPLINFLGFAYIVRRYGWPAIKQYLGERQRHALEAQGKATAALEAAEKRLAAAEERCGRLDDEKERLKREVIGAAERLRDRVLQAAERGARRIGRDTELVVIQEERKAVLQVRGELAEATIREAEELIKAKISERDQERFRRLLLDEVGQE